MTHFAESTIEQAALDWFTSLGYTCAFGLDLAFDGATPQRLNYQEVVVAGRLRRKVRVKDLSYEHLA
jgi:type I restriction enzyme, R subunit